MEIIIILILIILNGVFSMSEIALVSSRKFKLENQARKGHANARKALDLAENPNTFLSTVQIGITLIGILTGLLSGENLTNDLRIIVEKVPFLAAYSQPVSVFLVVLIVTYFSIVFGELLPKRIGLAFPETISTAIARPMSILSDIAKPFVLILAKTNDLLLKIFGIEEREEAVVSEEELKSILNESKRVGTIMEIEEDIVKRVFALSDRRAGELMTHRSDLICIDIKDSLEVIKAKVDRSPHAVYPVIDKSPDKLLGIVSLNKIFSQLRPENPDVRHLMKKASFVQENMPAYKVLERFREDKVHVVVVVDEYGSIEGLLSVTDVVDAIIGEITEYTDDELHIVQRDENSWLIDGQHPFYGFVQFFDLEDEVEPEGFTTLAGLILKHLNHYPVTGEKIQWKGFELEIVDMDERRIDKVLVRRINVIK